jgi:hypothetical protein
MNKGLIIGISAAVVGIGGVLAYRYFVPPTLTFREYTPSTHSGKAEFGGVSNNFGNGNQYTQVGRFGWELEVKPNSKGESVFNLLKNGKLIKELTIK